jgi:hypothetical protein
MHELGNRLGIGKRALTCLPEMAREKIFLNDAKSEHKGHRCACTRAHSKE